MKIEPNCGDLPSTHFSKDIKKLSAFHDWLKLTPYLDRETLINWYSTYTKVKRTKGIEQAKQV